jgi:hypothetical protein
LTTKANPADYQQHVRAAWREAEKGGDDQFWNQRYRQALDARGLKLTQERIEVKDSRYPNGRPSFAPPQLGKLDGWIFETFIVFKEDTPK